MNKLGTCGINRIGDNLTNAGGNEFESFESFVKK